MANFCLNPEALSKRQHQGDVAPATTSIRRRLFGRSHDSAASGGKSIGSKDSPLPSPTVHEVEKDSGQGESPRHSGNFGTRKGKKASDGGKHGDRLSIFSGSFVGPLSKHRKPAPRFANSIILMIL